MLQQVLKVLPSLALQDSSGEEIRGDVCGIHTGDLLGVPLVSSPVSLGMSQGPSARRWLQDCSHPRMWQSCANPELT